MILINKPIGDFDGGYSASDFLNDLKENKSKNDEIIVLINSPGGSVFDGFAIVSQILKARKDGFKFKAKIALAASAASYVACACNVVEVDETSAMMIHNPMTDQTGNSSHPVVEDDSHIW